MRANPYQLHLPFERRWNIMTLKKCIHGHKGGSLTRAEIGDYLHRMIKMNDGEYFYIEMDDTTHECYKYVLFSREGFNTIELVTSS